MNSVAAHTPKREKGAEDIYRGDREDITGGGREAHAAYICCVLFAYMRPIPRAFHHRRRRSPQRRWPPFGRENFLRYAISNAPRAYSNNLHRVSRAFSGITRWLSPSVTPSYQEVMLTGGVCFRGKGARGGRSAGRRTYGRMPMASVERATSCGEHLLGPKSIISIIPLALPRSCLSRNIVLRSSVSSFPSFFPFYLYLVLNFLLM